MGDDSHIRLTDIIDVDEEYREEVKRLKDNVEDRNVPSWILISDRSSGEHATGSAWYGVVLACCSEGSGSIDTRVAIDVRDRHRVQSSVGTVPRILRENIQKAQESVDREIEVCIARFQYDTTTREIESVNLLLRLEESKETVS